MNLSQTDITYISIAIGYTIIIIAYNKYIQYFDINESNSLDIVKTVFNVFMYMGILLAWFFTKQSAQTKSPKLLTTMAYAAITLFVSGIFLYVSYSSPILLTKSGSSKNLTVNIIYKL